MVLKVESESISVCEQSIVRYGAVNRGVIEELIDHVAEAVEKAAQERELWIVCEWRSQVRGRVVREEVCLGR